jgi:hypothetical protein
MRDVSCSNQDLNSRKSFRSTLKCTPGTTRAFQITGSQRGNSARYIKTINNRTIQAIQTTPPQHSSKNANGFRRYRLNPSRQVPPHLILKCTLMEESMISDDQLCERLLGCGTVYLDICYVVVLSSQTGLPYDSDMSNRILLTCSVETIEFNFKAILLLHPREGCRDSLYITPEPESAGRSQKLENSNFAFGRAENVMTREYHGSKKEFCEPTPVFIFERIGAFVGTCNEIQRMRSCQRVSHACEFVDYISNKVPQQANEIPSRSHRAVYSKPPPLQDRH